MAALLRGVRDGNYFRHAAEATGIHFTTAYDWVTKGDNAITAARTERPEIDAEIADWLLVFPTAYYKPTNDLWSAPPPAPWNSVDREEEWQFVLFATLMRRAKAEAVTQAVTQIRRAGRDQWQAAAWYLERTNHAEFGRKTSLEHSGPDGGPVTIEAATPEELAERIKTLKREHQQRTGTAPGGQ